MEVAADPVYVKINGQMRYRWRAADQEGEVLESYVTKTRDKATAPAFIKKALKRHVLRLALSSDSCVDRKLVAIGLLPLTYPVTYCAGISLTRDRASQARETSSVR